MWLRRLWRRWRRHRKSRYPLLYKLGEPSDEAGNPSTKASREPDDARDKRQKQQG